MKKKREIANDDHIFQDIYPCFAHDHYSYINKPDNFLT